ncbi:hypothetical protein GCM10027299_22040 [Larkinella ripae]
MKPIDWPRILANPDAFADHLPRLDERISKWSALCELCNMDEYGIVGFDRQLTALVRDFFLVVKRRQWATAREMYDQILALRGQIAGKPPLTIHEKHAQTSTTTARFI